MVVFNLYTCACCERLPLSVSLTRSSEELRQCNKRYDLDRNVVEITTFVVKRILLVERAVTLVLLGVRDEMAALFNWLPKLTQRSMLSLLIKSTVVNEIVTLSRGVQNRGVNILTQTDANNQESDHVVFTNLSV